MADNLTAELAKAKRIADGLQSATRLAGLKPNFTGCGGPAAEDYWEYFTPARIATLLTAVEAALGFHVEAVIEDMPEPRFRYCKTCSGHPEWPCPEVRAITRELTGKEAGRGVSTPDHGAPSRPPGRAHQLPVLRELGWATWAGSESLPGDPDRHKHDAEGGVPFFAHSHNDGADAHDHMPPEEADSGDGS